MLAMSFLSIRAVAQRAPGTYVPGETKVAIIPAVDASGEKREKTNIARCKVVMEAAVRQFHGHGFTIMNADVVTAAIKKLNVDMSDEEQRKRATMLSVGKEAGADLVVFVIITDADDTYVARAVNIKAWLLDVASEKAFLSARAQQGISNATSGLDLGHIDRALRMAVDDEFKEFLKPYKSGK